MADDLSIFGRLTGLTPSGNAKDAKEVPVDKDSRRRAKAKKRKRPEKAPGDISDLGDRETKDEERTRSGKVVDIVI